MEHADIERHHQAIALQAFEGQTFADLVELQCSLQARVLFLNQEYPMSALGDRPPFQVFPQARHSSRVYHVQIEEQLLDMQRVYDYLKTACWFRKVIAVGTFSLGGFLYNATTHFAEQTLEITFDATTGKFVCLPEHEEPAFHLETIGLTKAALMGNISLLPALCAYQLPLPFAYPDTT